MTSARTLQLGAALAAFLLLVPAEAQAQGAVRPAQSPPGAHQSMEARQQLMNRVQRDFERNLARELGLSTEQMASLRRVTFEFWGPRSELMRERGQLRAAMERLSQATTADEAAARRLLDRHRALRARELELQRQEEERLLEFLTPGQLLGLHRMRDELSQQIRRLETEVQQRRGGPGSGGPPWGPRPGGPDPS
jgi:Spy/CpxP family protein refolding chaperone